MVAPSLLTLPGELRNLVFEQVVSNMDITIREGTIVTPPFAQTCRRLRREFLSFFRASEQNLKPKRTTIQICNFDFARTVDTLSSSCDVADSSFDIQIRVSKPMGRAEWHGIWSWVHFCDSLSLRHDNVGASKTDSTYSVEANLAASDLEAALRALYVEVIPFVLKGGAGRGQTTAGYQQIEKMRAALAACIDR